MKKLFYIVYFTAIANYLMPVGDVFGMAVDMISPSYEVASVSYTSCSSIKSGIGVSDSVKAVFTMYGSAAKTGGFCSL